MSTSPQSPLPPIIIQPASPWRWPLLVFGVLGWLACLCCLLIIAIQAVMTADYFDTTGGVYEKYDSGEEAGRDKVAILAIEGLIADGDGYVKSQIDRIRDDERVKAVVVRVDSPGGTITASDYIYHHLRRLREQRNLPMVVSMGGIAASGGYYVAMAVGDQERSIFAEPTTTTGSIGVIVPHYDLSGLLARFDVKDDSIVSHPRKEMLSITKPVPDDHRQLAQAYVDEAFGRFKEIVKSGRPALRDDATRLDNLATGEIFTATKAKEAGLIDEIGFLEEALDRAIELAGLNKDRTRVIRYERPDSLLSLSGLALAQGPRGDLEQLFELSTPRAYYLATSLPPLAASYSWLIDLDRR